MEIDSPTDWVNTRAPYLQHFEECIRCPICHGIYEMPAITECAHTFCGLCIRRHLDADSGCPTCRVEVQRSRLRPNNVIEDACGVYRRCRSSLIAALSQPNREVRAPANEMLDYQETLQKPYLDDAANPSEKNDNSGSSAEPQNYELTAKTEFQEHSGDNQALKHPPEMAQCPVCNEWWPLDVLQSVHVTECLAGGSRKRPLRHRPPTKRQATPNYNILKDKALRELLAKVELPCNGSRAVMIARHREFVNQWNTSVEAVAGKSAEDIRRAVMAAERHSHATNDTPLKELDTYAHVQKHHTDFLALAQQARAQLKKGSKGTTN